MWFVMKRRGREIGDVLVLGWVGIVTGSCWEGEACVGEDCTDDCGSVCVRGAGYDGGVG